MSSVERLLLCAFVLVVGYAILANRLIVFGKRFRRRALDLGTKLLEDPAVPPEVKAGIEVWLVDIPKRSSAWFLAALVIPAAVCSIWFRLTRRSVKLPPMIPPRSATYWHMWDDFTNNAMIAILCNSPLASAVFITEMIFASFVISTHVVVVAMMENIVRHEDHRIRIRV